jgi:hypothetical protein
MKIVLEGSISAHNRYIVWLDLDWIVVLVDCRRFQLPEMLLLKGLLSSSLLIIRRQLEPNYLSSYAFIESLGES